MTCDFCHSAGGTLLLDDVSVKLAQQAANGTVSFADVDTGDTHIATFAPDNGGAGYIGTFTLDSSVAEANGRLLLFATAPPTV